MEPKDLKPREKDWLRQRRTILRKIKDQVRLYLGPEPADIREYAQAYREDVERPWQISAMADIQKEILASRVVFGGDFHSFPQAQRAHLRILRNLPEDTRVALALEIFPSSRQGEVDLFISGALSEEDFLEAIDWDSNWGFPWSFYRPLLECAWSRGWKVLGVNRIFTERSQAILENRDRFAAEKVYDALKVDDADLVYVLYGDLHIAQKNLPRAFSKLYPKGGAPKAVTIYLNPEKVYFELAEQGVESRTEAVSYRNNQFAIISSPPWVKWQNYLMFLEENHDYGFEDYDDDDDVDYTDHVLSLVRMISSALDVEINENDMEVYTSREPVALVKAQEALPKLFLSIAKFLLKTDRSFYIPSQGFFYLSKPSVNHVATLAAQYVHAKLSRRSRLLWDFPQAFLGLIWVEAMGFFLSKFVNPKRKAQTMNDLKKQLAVFHPRDEGREPLLLALDQKMAELLEVFKGESRGQNFQPRKKSSYIEAARFLGPILGERYFRLYEDGVLNRDQVLELLSFDPTEAEIRSFYYKQLSELDKLEAQDRDVTV